MEGKVARGVFSKIDKLGMDIQREKDKERQENRKVKAETERVKKRLRGKKK